jgi:hypothetical protein
MNDSAPALQPGRTTAQNRTRGGSSGRAAVRQTDQSAFGCTRRIDPIGEQGRRG